LTSGRTVVIAFLGPQVISDNLAWEQAADLRDALDMKLRVPAACSSAAWDASA
jgi:hypothetical protein